MYSAGSPRQARTDDMSLRLARARRRAIDRPSASAPDRMLREYLADMTRPYRLALREELFDQPVGHFYGDMAAALVSQTVSPAEPVDLVVFAYAIPDVRPGRSTAAHFSHLCPGRPMAFAVYDQGAAAPFTGLRLIREYFRSGECQRALLVVAEQRAVHYELASPAAVPARSVAVTLLCVAGSGRAADTAAQHVGVPHDQAGDLLAGELEKLPAGGRDATLIVGNGLARHAGSATADEVITAPPGQPCTGVWWELAGGFRSWTAQGRRVLLADYDPVLGYLCLSAVHIEATQRETEPRLAARPAP
jgi:hypothetical protein